MGSEWKKVILLDNTVFEVEGTQVHIFTIVHKRQNTEGIPTENLKKKILTGFDVQVHHAKTVDVL